MKWCLRISLCGVLWLMAIACPADLRAEAIDCSYYRPVIFIHGLLSEPKMWEEAGSDYVGALKRMDYPHELIGLYGYSGTGETYNNQGGIEEVSRGLRPLIEDLSARSQACGGYREVVVVAHSMGGLVARQYISSYSNDHLVHQVISVGTPYQGSWLLAGYESQVGFLARIVSQSVQSSTGKSLWLDVSKQAYADLSPKSEKIKFLAEQDDPLNIHYHLLYGDIQARSYIKIFHLLVYGQAGSLGDLVVDSGSAQGIGTGQVIARKGYGSEVVAAIELRLNSRLRPEYRAGGNGLNGLRFNHLSLMSQPEIMDYIIGLVAARTMAA